MVEGVESGSNFQELFLVYHVSHDCRCVNRFAGQALLPVSQIRSLKLVHLGSERIKLSEVGAFGRLC